MQHRNAFHHLLNRELCGKQKPVTKPSNHEKNSFFEKIPSRCCIELQDIIDREKQLLRSVVLGFTRDANYIGKLVFLRTHHFSCISNRVR